MPAPGPAAPASTGPPRPTREGERRLVAVLFADVSGFTAMSERLDPEQVTAIMNECFRRLGEAIDRHGGTIDKYIGDAVMALFGAPIAHENDAERAVLAALAMQDALRTFADELAAALGIRLAMRIGVNTGEVIAGEVGSAIKTDYTVMGDTVNLASRLEHEARVGHILVSEAVYRLTHPFFEFQPMGPLTIRGKREPVHAYEVVGVRAQRGQSRGLPGRITPLVGRERELAALQAALAGARRGEPQLVELVGEAGLGKSRLAAELAAAAPELRRVTGRALPYDALNTYHLAATLIRNALGLEEGADPALVREAIARALGDRLAIDLVAQVLVVGDPAEPDPAALLSPEMRRRETFFAVRSILDAALASEPCLIILEDLHWADAPSLDLLRFVVEGWAGRPFLVLAAFRPDFAGLAAWPPALARTRLELQALDADAALRLAEVAVEQDRLPDHLLRAVRERAGGNPFFVEEIVKAYQETAGGASPEAEIGPFRVPPTVQGLLMARLDRLEPANRRLLQAAAVLGQEVSRPLLLALAEDLPGSAEALASLVRLDLLRPASPPAFPPATVSTYRFPHGLLRDVAYQSLLIQRRQALHGDAGRAIERLFADRLAEHLHELAHHFHEGEVWDRAVAYALQAGERARRLYDNATAVALFDRALADLDHLAAPSPALPAFLKRTTGVSWSAAEVTHARLAARRGRGDVAAVTGRYPDALADFTAALADAESAAALAEHADLWLRLGEVNERRGNYSEALAALDAGLQILVNRAPRPTEPVAAGRLLTAKAFVHCRQGRYEAARAAVAMSMELLEGAGSPPLESSRAQRVLGMVYAGTGDWIRARECFAHSLELAGALADPRDRTQMLNNLAVAAARTGDLPRAIASFSEALPLLERIGDLATLAGVRGNLAGCYRLQGEIALAISHYEAALAVKERIGDRHGVARQRMNLGEALRESGRLDEARAHLAASLALLEELGAAESLPECCRQIAETALAAGDVQEARAQAERALGLARQTGNRLEEGHAARVLGLTAARAGDAAIAREHLWRSRDLLHVAGTSRELAAVEAALSQLSAPESSQ